MSSKDCVKTWVTSGGPQSAGTWGNTQILGIAALGWAVASGAIASLGLPELGLLVVLVFAPPLDALCSRVSISSRAGGAAAEARRKSRQPTGGVQADETTGRLVGARPAPVFAEARRHTDESIRAIRRRHRRESELFEDPEPTRGMAFTPLPDDLRVPDLSDARIDD